jgi:hypothetical protein
MLTIPRLWKLFQWPNKKEFTDAEELTQKIRSPTPSLLVQSRSEEQKCIDGVCFYLNLPNKAAYQPGVPGSA